MDVRDHKIALLEERVELLQHMNRELQAAAGRNDGFDGLPYLSRIEATLLALLARHGHRTNEQIYFALYAGRIDTPQEDTIKVHVSNLRGRLKGTGIEIITHFAVGYELEAASREMVLMSMRAFDLRQRRASAA